MIYHIGFYLLCSVCRLPQWLSDKESACNAGTEGVAGAVGSNPSLGREDYLKKEMATHSSILAWEIHGQRSLAGYSL